MRIISAGGSSGSVPAVMAARVMPGSVSLRSQPGQPSTWPGWRLVQTVDQLGWLVGGDDGSGGTGVPHGCAGWCRLAGNLLAHRSSSGTGVSWRKASSRVRLLPPLLPRGEPADSSVRTSASWPGAASATAAKPSWVSVAIVVRRLPAHRSAAGWRSDIGVTRALLSGRGPRRPALGGAEFGFEHVHGLQEGGALVAGQPVEHPGQRRCHTI